MLFICIEVCDLTNVQLQIFLDEFVSLKINFTQAYFQSELGNNHIL